ncbi:MAG: YihA family ribosome biogenesis GTP-binding protein [Clostridia bacterium]|nr:YihA family ribosome biogenesis GTP-binding protein [Clostridia bacterium]
MKFTPPKFITSAADKRGFLQTDKPIICITGKSNVGKSSFINMLAMQKKLAKTSNTPGRTRLVNYFDFGEFILADLPGYGYAQVSKTEKEKWGKTLDDFFRMTDITLAISLVDIRHDPTEDDKMMIKYLYAQIIPFVLVATKADKIAKTKVKAQAAQVAAKLGLSGGDIIPTSSETRLGRDQVFSVIYKALSSKGEGDFDGDEDADIDVQQ